MSAQKHQGPTSQFFHDSLKQFQPQYNPDRTAKRSCSSAASGAAKYACPKCDRKGEKGFNSRQALNEHSTDSWMVRQSLAWHARMCFGRSVGRQSTCLPANNRARSAARIKTQASRVCLC